MPSRSQYILLRPWQRGDFLRFTPVTRRLIIVDKVFRDFYLFEDLDCLVSPHNGS